MYARPPVRAALFALVFSSCFAFSESEPDPPRPPWASGDLVCFSGDGCPKIYCACEDDSEAIVRACLDGACLDDHVGFCRDWCADKGGRASATAEHLYACLGEDDREGCLACRDSAARECNADACGVALDALLACVTSFSPRLPDEVEYYGWDTPDEGLCLDERSAHEGCLDDDCPAFGECVQDPGHHPPIAR